MDYINLRLTGKFAATQNTALPMMMIDNRRLTHRIRSVAAQDGRH
jgi:hypothetical protein